MKNKFIKLCLGILGGFFIIGTVLFTIFVPISFLKPDPSFFDFVLAIFFVYVTYYLSMELKSFDKTKPFPGMIFHYDSQKYYFSKRWFFSCGVLFFSLSALFKIQGFFV